MTIYALRNAPEDDRARLKEILAMHTSEIHLVREGISILERCGALSFAGDRAEQIVRSAYAQASPLIPDGSPKDRIRRFADSLLNRDI
jgi:geranylgeranyl pyrophosphate synthase